MPNTTLEAPPADRRLVTGLVRLLGEKQVSASIVDRLAYAADIWPLLGDRVHKGDVPYWPGVIVWPENAEQIQAVLKLAGEFGVSVVPYAGGSGIVGGAVPLRGGITLDVKRINRILALDETSLTVTVEAGALLQDLEDELERRGYTLGHFPQSMRSAAVGGTIAHNGIGTFSTRYGKFDDMVLGMRVVLPTGEMVDILPVPKRSTGPNLNALFLGSEGTLGIVTQATLKIHPAPEKRIFQSYAVDDMRVGLDIMRRIMQADLRPAVVRLYDEVEGKGLLFHSLGIETSKCLLIFCYEGYEANVAFESRLGAAICGQVGAEDLGLAPGVFWYEKNRFDVRHYMAKTLPDNRVADTLEVAATWDRLADLYYAIREAMGRYPCISMGHASHAYPQGANLYMIFFAEAGSDEPEEVAALYNDILGATFETCARLGATISHHHGIGMAKGQWMELEHGSGGMAALRRIKAALDPAGIMNPGKLGLGG